MESSQQPCEEDMTITIFSERRRGLGLVTCSMSHSKEVVGPGLETSLSDSSAHTVIYYSVKSMNAKKVVQTITDIEGC